jgi:hypothetical protein
MPWTLIVLGNKLGGVPLGFLPWEWGNGGLFLRHHLDGGACLLALEWNPFQALKGCRFRLLDDVRGDYSLLTRVLQC